MKKEVIAISLVFLIISTSFVGAVEISDLIEGQAKIQDLVKDNEQQEPEDIFLCRVLSAESCSKLCI